MKYELRSGTEDEEAHYTPYGGVRQAFLCHDQEMILSGPAETGKTLGMLYKLHICACKYPNAAIVILRKQLTDTYATAIRTFTEKVLDDDVPIRIYGGASPRWFSYPNGSRIWSAGLDKTSKVLSAEYDIIFVNQVEELSLPDWEILTTRTTGRAGNMPYSQTLGDCNPAAPTHWIRSRAQEGKLTLFESTHQDNPTLYDPMTGELTEQGQRTLSVLDNLTGSRKLRLRHGIWAAPEGAIYSVFDEAKHKVESFPIPSLWPKFVGIDPMGAYIAAVWVALDPVNKVLNVYREYIEPFGIPTRQHVENILHLSGYMPDGRPLANAETIFYWCGGGPSERQARLDFQAAGLPLQRPGIGDVWAGIDRVNELLSDFAIVIHDNCPNLLSEAGDYRRKLKDGIPTDTIDNKERYHGLDALRYGCAGPETEGVQEEIVMLPWQRIGPY